MVSALPLWVSHILLTGSHGCNMMLYTCVGSTCIILGRVPNGVGTLSWLLSTNREFDAKGRYDPFGDSGQHDAERFRDLTMDSGLVVSR